MINYLIQTPKPIKCWGCGRPAELADIKSYNHDGGWGVEFGKAHRKWYYINCPCGYATSFDKLGIPRNAPIIPSFRQVAHRIHPDHNRHPEATGLMAALIRHKNNIEWYLRRFQGQLIQILH